MTVEPVTRIEGTALPLDRADVDTDQIIPAQYLKRIERTGFGPFLFDEWRKDPSFVLNDERYSGATILLAGPNFGAGEREESAEAMIFSQTLRWGAVNRPPSQSENAGARNSERERGARG